MALPIAPGQAQELPHAVPLLDTLPGTPQWAVADRGYASHALRQHGRGTARAGPGRPPAVPAKRNEVLLPGPTSAFTNRNLVERPGCRLKG